MLRSSPATAAFASLGLGFAAMAQSALLAGPKGAEVEVEADRIVYTWQPRVIRLEGHVVARRGGGLLRAASGTLDRERGILKLEGGVLGIQGQQVFLADSAVVDLNARSAEMANAVLFLKARAPNPAAPRDGPNTMIVHGKSGRQLPNGHYVAEKVRLTPCDCAGEPDYELVAESAEIDEDRAHLRGVDLRLLGVPLPLFPLSVPLTNRQSGLLAPQPGWGGPSGFAYAQPVFLTLGPSADVTVAPGVFTGGSVHGQALGARSIKGPRLGLEGRYAPVTGTAGSLALDLFYDLDQRDPNGTGPGRGYGGVRGVAHLSHRTEGGANTFAVQGLAVTDVMMLRDQSALTIENSFDLFTTDVGVWRASGPVTLGADATLIQDMRVINGSEPDRKLLSGEAAGATMHRLPALFTQVAPVPLGPATFSLEASAVQFARFGHPADLERQIGFGPTDRGAGTPVTLPDPTLPNGTDQSRPPALRLDLSPRLTLSGPRALPVDLRLEAGARADGWILEGSGDRNRARAYALVDARAAVPLERRFGSMLHRIEPALQFRAISKQLATGGPPIGDLTDGGGAAFSSKPDAAQQGLARGDAVEGVPAARRPYDEIDFAAPVTGAVEMTASLIQSLWTKPGATPGRIAHLELMQDALLWAGSARARLGEASASAGVQIGPGSLGGSVRYEWSLHAVSTFGISGGIRDVRGDEAHAGVGMLRGSSSERLRAGIDELFSAARFAIPPTGLTGNATLGASGPLPKNLRVGYDLTYTPGDLPSTFANFLHVLDLRLDAPCKCAGLRLTTTFQYHDGHKLQGPIFSLVIDLKSLGSYSTF